MDNLASSTVTYLYNGRDELLSATKTGPEPWSQSFGIDRWGNVAIDGGLAFDANTNWISSGGYDYDRQGNLYINPDQNHGYLRNGAGRLFEVWDLSGSLVATYSYDSSGQRVAKQEGGVLTRYYRDVLTKQVLSKFDEITPSAATELTDTKTQYYQADFLGTTQLVTDEEADIVYRADTRPYGQTKQPPPDVDRLFTGKTRDTTGLDYFLARYYDSRLARFLTIDPADGSANPLLPTSFNRYAYANNNPLRYVDPDGQIPVETLVDIPSAVADLYTLYQDPSLVNGALAVWGVAAIFVPYVPGSWAIKGGKQGAKFLNKARRLFKAKDPRPWGKLVRVNELWSYGPLGKRTLNPHGYTLPQYTNEIFFNYPGFKAARKLGMRRENLKLIYHEAFHNGLNRVLNRIPGALELRRQFYRAGGKYHQTEEWIAERYSEFRGLLREEAGFK